MKCPVQTEIPAAFNQFHHPNGQTKVPTPIILGMKSRPVERRQIEHSAVIIGPNKGARSTSIHRIFLVTEARLGHKPTAHYIAISSDTEEITISAANS